MIEKRLASLTASGLGLKRDGSVSLSPYNTCWAREFSKEAHHIFEALQISDLRLYHVGSTSIPGIHSKPIIDILIVTPSLQLLDSKKSVFENLGYEYKGEYGLPGRRYSVLYGPDKDISYVHLHAYEENDPEIERLLVFRDYLRKHKDEAQRYESFKLDLVKKQNLNRANYVEMKSSLIKDMILKAIVWRKTYEPRIESTQAAIRVTQERIAKMDQKTLSAYAENANEYSQDWLSQPEPSDMYELLQRYFIAGGVTADIGCGNGRDSNWLAKQGFKVTGYDASPQLIKLASGLYPDLSFQHALLPSLKEIQTQFDNVICETVIMHLSKDQILESLQNLKRILKTDGVIYLSWRVTEKEDLRHPDGRLYSAFDPELVVSQFAEKSILHFEDKISKSSGKRVCRLIVRQQA